MNEELIFNQSKKDRVAHSLKTSYEASLRINKKHLRTSPIGLPELSELQVVRHFTRLSKLNFSIDTNFYPLGSCTMKYNPRACNKLAMLPNFLQRHPLRGVRHSQGVLHCLHELQEILMAVTGMSQASLTPMAGAQGELAGVAMILAYHKSRGETHRNEIIVPDGAHGTNPATAIMCGCKVIELSTKDDGNLDIVALKAHVGKNTAGIMLTNPSTLGTFEQGIAEISDIVHGAGALMYYDGANLNAILGRVLPAAMGFDVMHINLHKTFATPHGGGGPGSGAVAVNEKLMPFLPIPFVLKDNSEYRWAKRDDVPLTIGRLSAFMGNTGVLLRALIYAKMLGKNGMSDVSAYATLNANYLMTRLSKLGFQLAYPNRRASHEFAITIKPITRETGVTAMDVAKALLDQGFHAPTTYFPLLIPECLLIEPTETETKETLDEFIDAMKLIKEQTKVNPIAIKEAPKNLPLGRLDDVKAVKELNVKF
jgi:glycine dehydrogenase subunit 2